MICDNNGLNHTGDPQRVTGWLGRALTRLRRVNAELSGARLRIRCKNKMETILTIIKYLSFISTTILTVFLGLSFTRLERSKHPILKIADGKKLRLFIAIIVCVVIGTILNFREDMINLNSKEVLEGDIVSEKPVKHHGYLNIVIGNSKMKITNSEYQHGHAIKPFMLLCGSDYEITFRKGKNQVLISAEITSIDGKIVAEIIDNEWRINPNNYFKKTYSDQRLEITDNYNLPILM